MTSHSDHVDQLRRTYEHAYAELSKTHSNPLAAVDTNGVSILGKAFWTLREAEQLTQEEPLNPATDPLGDNPQLPNTPPRTV